jgi:integrase
VAAATAQLASASQPAKTRGRPRKARPYQIDGRSGWWANPTLPDGSRPLRKFESEAKAEQWIAEQLEQAAAGLQPALGGPERATVAQMLFKYAYRCTVLKGGADAELTRINNYLHGGGLPALRLVTDDSDRRKLEQMAPRPRAKNQEGWQQYIDVRRGLRTETYALIHRIGSMTCAKLTTELLGDLATTMESEGLSPSTVQKELALLKAAFNTAIREWRWKGFENPAVGIKLGKSESRFVRVSSDEEQRLVEALNRCDNPQMLPLVELAITTCARKGSLLAMKWSQVSLETREVHVWGKGFNVTLPLSRRAVELLKGLPRDGTDKVFSMSSNAVQLAWNHVRENAQLPNLQFRDLRHVGATFYARAGFNPHQLKAVLGHKSTRMAEVYVNLVNADVHEALDRAEAERGIARPLPPADVHAGRDVKAIMAERRAQRLNGQPELPPNVVRFPKKRAA